MIRTRKELKFGKYSSRDNLKKIYIFTEGKETEVKYFQAKKKEIENEIRKSNIIIKIKGVGLSTSSLLKESLNSINKEKNINLKYDDCWLVFDKDDFKDFDSTIEQAEKEGIKIAYSNKSFELWFLLHFNFIISAIENTECKNKLEKYLKNLPENKNNKDYKYEKNKCIYEEIKDKESDAIKNAEKLLKQYNEKIKPSGKDPSTTVHLLIKALNQLKVKDNS